MIITDISTLIDKLNSFNKIFSKETDKWIFRGQGDKDWKVQSSFQRYFENQTDYKNKKLYDFYQLHDSFIEDFFNNLEGHLEHPFERIDYLKRRLTGFPFTFRNLKDENLCKLKSLIALGQHYELETVFVDWTRDSIIGLGFAIEQWINSNFNKNDNISNIVLFALNENHELFTKECIYPIKISNNLGDFAASIEIIEENPNAKKWNKHSHFQKGLFTCTRIFELSKTDDILNYRDQNNSRISVNYDSIKNYLCLDYLFLDQNITNNTNYINNINNSQRIAGEVEVNPERYSNVDNFFHKIEIDYKLIPQILKYIESFYGSAGLYPSYQGCVNTVKINRKYKKITESGIFN